MSSRRSRSKSSDREYKRKHKRRHSRERSPEIKQERRSSSISYRSRSYSKSMSPSEKHKKRRSHKTSSRRERRSRSYTPVGSHRDSRDRDDPTVCHCLGVFGLSNYTNEKDLKEVFAQYGEIDDICIIYDRQSGHSKGYGFVYFKSTADAIEARKNTQGLVLDRRPIRVDYSFTVRPHSPTPGRYLGRRSRRDLDRYSYNDESEYNDHRSYRDDSRRNSYRDWH